MQQNTGRLIYEYELASSIPGRLRIGNPALKDNKALCGEFTRRLSAAPGITMLTANYYTGRVLIIYDASKLDEMQVISLVTGFFKSEGSAAGPQGAAGNGMAVKASSGKVIRADFRSKRLLTAKEFRDSRNVLSREFYDYNVNALLGKVPEDNIECCYHNVTAEEAVRRLKTDMSNGLSGARVQELVKSYGLNELYRKQKKSLISTLLNQFEGFIINLLISAAGISALLGHIADAAAILAIIAVEAALGAWQEYKAEKSLESLKQLTVSTAHVIRGGKHIEIAAGGLVPGDIICLEAGNSVPADARLIESSSLETVEASLTGESQPVSKTARYIRERNIPLGDRRNMVYTGTSVVRGKCRAVVTATGMNTEMGKMAGMLNSSVHEKTPLQKDLDKLGRFITWVCIYTCAAVTVAGIIAGHQPLSMLSTGISLAVGAIPEGLATVLAVSFAFGARRMAKKNAIVKTMPSVETLSCTKVICTDKTGTLTRNEMTVKEIFLPEALLKVSGDGYNSRGEIHFEGTVNPSEHAGLRMLLTSAVLCNNAHISEKGNGNFTIKGDPTEAALLIAVEKSGMRLQDFKCYKRVHEIPFEAETKKMSAICSDKAGNYFIFTKGAVDTLLEKCSGIQRGGSVESLSKHDLSDIIGVNDTMADNALRVLGFAYKPLDAKPASYDTPELEEGLVFLGLIGVMDPPREEAASAIEKCRAAGIKVVMITGDHKKTAAAVARSLNLLMPEDIIMTGDELDAIEESRLNEIIDKVKVFARTCPGQKLKIVKAFKSKGYIVTMTGDGINDAPALKEANVGIAMGKSGTDVTKDVSSIILMDDDFGTIVKAVEEGRTINRNIKKFIRYVLTGNFAEVLAIALAAIAGLPLPLLPIQILAFNLITEGIPALSLGLDPPERDIMKEPPRDPSSTVFDSGVKRNIIKRGVVTGLSTLGLFGGALYLGLGAARARTLAFTNLVTSQLLHALQCSSSGINNKYLLPSVAVSAASVLLAIYLPPLGSILGMAPLGALEWCCVALSAAVTGIPAFS